MTNKMFNLIQLSTDMKISKNFALFGYIGTGNAYGAGITFQSDYNKSGLIIGLSKGVDLDKGEAFSTSFAYQWEIKKSTFISLGISTYSTSHSVVFYDMTSTSSRIEREDLLMPVISYDFRF